MMQICLMTAKMIMKTRTTVFLRINNLGIVCIPKNRMFFKIQYSIQKVQRKRSDNLNNLLEHPYYTLSIMSQLWSSCFVMKSEIP